MPKGSTWYSDEYKYEVFLIWYNNYKPSSSKLYDMIPEALGTDKPTKSTLLIWINTRFTPQAESMDLQVQQELENRIVKEKVEMLSRHAGLGQEMQDIAMAYINDKNNKDKLTSNTAVRLLVEGVRIERDSRGLPQAIEKMVGQSDEDLLEKIQGILKDSPVEILDE